MKEYDVTITETLQKTFTVEAMSKDDAEQMVHDMWNDADIVLDFDDFLDVSFRSNQGKEIEETRKIDVLLVEPGQYARVVTIGSKLESLQETVGGDIEAAYYFDDPVALICNEEGKINGLRLNRAVKDENGEIVDIIAGTFFICGLTEDSFGSLPEELQQKYLDQFRQPETFLKLGRSIAAIPTEPDKPLKEKSAASHGVEL